MDIGIIANNKAAHLRVMETRGWAQNEEPRADSGIARGSGKRDMVYVQLRADGLLPTMGSVNPMII